MEKKYFFETHRFSIVQKNDFIVQGYVSKGYMQKNELKAYMGDNELAMDIYQEEGSYLSGSTENANTENVRLNVVIHLGDNYESAGNKFVIRDASGDVIYSIGTGQLVRMQKKLNYCMDNIYVNDGNLTAKGWVMSLRPVDITVYCGENKIDTDIIWNYRGAVNEVFFETEEPIEKNGFTIHGKGVSGKIRIVMDDGEKKDEITYKISDKEGFRNLNRKSVFYRGVRYLQNYGVKRTIGKTLHFIKKHRQYDMDYMQWRKKHTPTRQELESQRQQVFGISPKFSIIVPLYKTSPVFLDELIQSVKAQTYSNWELCFSDGSNDGKLNELLKKYAEDERIHYLVADRQLGIAENTNEAIKLINGDYVVLGDHDDLFAPNALYECVKILQDSPDIDVIYTDEDKITENSKKYYDPNCKPDFNIDLLRSNNYICHMFVIKKDLLQKIGNFNKDFDGAQDYDFILRATEAAKHIYHIPKILYHWRSHGGSTADDPESKMYAIEAGKRAIEAHYERVGLKAKVDMLPELGFYKTTYEIIGQPLVSIVIPNKDHIGDLDVCIRSIQKKTDYKNYEIVVVENNSTEKETFEYYEQLREQENVRVIIWDKEFNYAAINNYGVNETKGEYLLFLNNDTEIINADWLSQMLGYCQREDVGIVGARLYYEDHTIQHAGTIIGFGGIAGNAFVALNEEDELYQSRTKVAVDYSAVTAACMMIKRDIFLQVGGFDEAFKVAFNDVDLCVKVRTLDKLVVYNPNAMLYHYESKSRGAEDTPEKVARFAREIELFSNKWNEMFKDGDPYYNINLTLDKADFSLRY